MAKYVRNCRSTMRERIMTSYVSREVDVNSKGCLSLGKQSWLWMPWNVSVETDKKYLIKMMREISNETYFCVPKTLSLETVS